jgi:hypothetical protein
MAERNRPQFGDKLPRRASRKAQGAEMFPDGADLPIFSGTPQKVIDRPFVPEARIFKQAMLPGMPGVDYEHIRELDRQKRRRRQKADPVAEAGTLWRFEEAPDDPATEQPEQDEGVETGQPLSEILAGYQLDTAELRRLVAMGSDLNERACRRDPRGSDAAQEAGRGSTFWHSTASCRRAHRVPPAGWRP